MNKPRIRPIGQRMETKKCLLCFGSFTAPIWRKRKFCSVKCAARNPLNKKALGVKHSEETKKKMSDLKNGIIPKNVLRGDFRGNKHHLWIEDRSKLKKQDCRSDSAYKEWRKQVWLRDNFKCKIANPGCEGRIEAHHILGWAEFPELRYEVNNGITLCHAHHPRKRAEEKRLSPYFQSLVSVSKDQIGG